MSKARMRDGTGAGCLPFGPSKHIWDSPNKGGSHTLQQPERWAPWQKTRQIVCLPSDKEHWLHSSEMVSNMGFCVFWPQRGTTSPARISGEFLMSKWRILWRFQDKYRHPGQLSLSQASRKAVTQYIMACLGCQQSHTGPRQSRVWALQLHRATVAKAHQLHSHQQRGQGCYYHPALPLIPQPRWPGTPF